VQKAYQLWPGGIQGNRSISKARAIWITTQLRRAAVSIPSNIAEGYGRKTTKEYIQFLYVAYGSICELETQIMLSGDLGYLPRHVLEKLQDGIGEVEKNAKSPHQLLTKKPRPLIPRTLGSLNPYFGLLGPRPWNP